jgi:hypothetical protein
MRSPYTRRRRPGGMPRRRIPLVQARASAAGARGPTPAPAELAGRHPSRDISDLCDVMAALSIIWMFSACLFWLDILPTAASPLQYRITNHRRSGLSRQTYLRRPLVTHGAGVKTVRSCPLTRYRNFRSLRRSRGSPTGLEAGRQAARHRGPWAARSAARRAAYSGQTAPRTIGPRAATGSRQLPFVPPAAGPVSHAPPVGVVDVLATFAASRPPDSGHHVNKVRGPSRPARAMVPPITPAPAADFACAVTISWAVRATNVVRRYAK